MVKYTKKGVTVLAEVIDPNYHGEIELQLYNESKEGILSGIPEFP